MFTNSCRSSPFPNFSSHLTELIMLCCYCIYRYRSNSSGDGTAIALHIFASITIFPTMQGHQRGVKRSAISRIAGISRYVRSLEWKGLTGCGTNAREYKYISKGSFSNRGNTPGESRIMNEKDLLRKIDELERGLRKREKKIRRMEEAAHATSVSRSIRTSMAIPMLHLRNDAELIRGEISRIRSDPARIAAEESEKDLKKLLELIDNLDRYSNLMGEFLESLRRGRWRLREPESPVDLNAVVKRWFERIETHPSFGQGIEVETRLNPYIPWIAVRESDLFQMIYHLTGNSFEALSARGWGKVVIGTDMEMDRVILSVSDNGPGIPPEIQNSIFKPFFSTKSSDKGSASRCGMGLYTVSSIVRSAGGEVRLRSTEGIETVFELLLPMYSAGEGRQERKTKNGGSVNRENE